jgi:hypothetical protein
VRGAAVLVDRILIDPHNPRQLAGANARLAKYALNLTCTGSCGPSAPPVRKSDDAVYYRQPRTIFLQITDTKTGALRSVYPVHSFNGSPLIAHRFERGPFIERKTEITYSHGVPLTVKHTKPSEALGLVTGVGEVAGAIVFSPFNALTSQTASVNTQKANLAAREQLLEQQQKTLQAEANYRAQYGTLPYATCSDPRVGRQNNPPSDADAEAAGR